MSVPPRPQLSVTHDRYFDYDEYTRILHDLVSKQQDKVALLTGQRLGPRPRVKEVLIRA